MRIGVPKEIKVHEYRVGLTPAGVRELCARGHEVRVQTQAGAGIGLSDAMYAGAGAQIVETAAEVWGCSELLVKVKEPQLAECAMLTPGHTLFAYLHLAADREQAHALLASGCTAIAYETVSDGRGGLPLLAPMSEVAGRMAIQAGARAMEKAQGGSGMLLGGVPGVAPAQVLLIGGGVVGYNAARIALGMGADVTVLDRSIERLGWLDATFGGRLKTLYSTAEALERALTQADLIVGAVLVPGAAAPRLVTRALMPTLRPGAAIVDVAIDQGGCCESSRPTTHDDPIYVEQGIVHYCVANMPGAVPRTSTFALTHATLPYVLGIAGQGVQAALLGHAGLRSGLNVRGGHIAHASVAQALGLQFHAPEALL